ncbi:MAG: branched-chain amino acid transaminase [bacterium]|mgnify:FL=1|jgi:branched-chain amino acid aminotransferase|nr:MAG: branched chain amino acid aminotransferase [bacterium]
MSGIPRTEWIWRDGTFIPWEAATVHVMSHVVHYGSSFFEGIRCYSTPNGPAIFRLRDHLRRLHDSCRIYRTELPFSVETLAQACCELVARNGLEDCYIRPVVFRGVGAPGLNPAASPVETYLVCWPWGAYLGADALERGVDVRVSSWSRMAPNTFPAMAKAGGNYIAAQLMKMEALADGYAEAIALDPNGLVSEGSGENVFLVRDEVLITPALNGSFLPGITRDTVITLARDLGIPVREQAVPREMLYIADEVFLTGTAAELTPVRSVDRIPVGNGTVGPITRAIQQKLMDILHGRAPDHYGWRTPVGQPTATAVA